MLVDTILNQLLSAIRQETELYRSMLTTIDIERDAVIRSDLKALTESGMMKENLLVKLHRLEEQRCILVSKLAEYFECSHQNLTLSKISQMVDKPFSGRLQQASIDLKIILDTVREANQGNKLLFEHSLELLRGSFNLISGLTDSNKVYYRTGNVGSIPPAGKCICSEI